MKKIQKSAVRFDNLKQDFLDDKKYSGTAEATLNGYQYDITRFLKFLSDEQLAVNEAGFKRYVIHLTDSGMTANSVNHYIRSVKVFLNVRTALLSGAVGLSSTLFWEQQHEKQQSVKCRYSCSEGSLNRRQRLRCPHRCTCWPVLLPVLHLPAALRCFDTLPC